MGLAAPVGVGDAALEAPVSELEPGDEVTVIGPTVDDVEPGVVVIGAGAVADRVVADPPALPGAVDAPDALAPEVVDSVSCSWIEKLPDVANTFEMLLISMNSITKPGPGVFI